MQRHRILCFYSAGPWKGAGQREWRGRHGGSVYIRLTLTLTLSEPRCPHLGTGIAVPTHSAGVSFTEPLLYSAPARPVSPHWHASFKSPRARHEDGIKLQTKMA